MWRSLLFAALLGPSAALQLHMARSKAGSKAQPPQLPLAKLQVALLSAMLAGTLSTPDALAAGSVAKLPLEVQSYEEVTCPESLAQGRAGGSLGAGAGGAGIAQKCVQVKYKTTNDTGNKVELAGVFGRVEGVKDGMSVLGNGQDGKNDAGQFAMIDLIPQGDSSGEFIFVAQQATNCKDSKFKDPETGKVVFKKCPVQGTEPLINLKFEKIRALGYPSGDRFKAYNECEQNEFAEGC